MTYTLEYWKDNNKLIGKLKEVDSVFAEGENLPQLQNNVLEIYSLLFNQIIELNSIEIK